jgi:membrane-bound serine protease (ClpP class)
MKTALLAVALLGALLIPALPTSGQQEVVVLPYDGAISPAAAEYITRGIDEAEVRHAAAVVLELDTPGGLDSAMRRIVQRELNSRVPVIVFVAPSGARAASAGLFIVLAADVAAMAPGTNIGAAHPIYISGGTVSEKIVNDSAAYARSIADTHHRNRDWAEKAVRESVSATAEEAISLGVIDLTANDVPQLLSALSAGKWKRAGGEPIPALAGAQVVTIEMDAREKFLGAITDPTVAYLLLLLGALAVVVEILAPHGYLTGSVGLAAVLLALIGLANLPVQISGLALLILGMALLGLELKITSHGILTLFGLGAFVLGSLLLLPRIPGYRISPIAIGAVSLIWVIMLGAVVRLVLRARRAPVLTGINRFAGREGVAKTDLAPRGVVLVGGEDWDALAETPPVARGERVVVASVDGLTLRVRKVS